MLIRLTIADGFQLLISSVQMF